MIWKTRRSVQKKTRQNKASESIEWSCISSDISMIDASMWFDKYFPIWFLPKRNLLYWRRFKSPVFRRKVYFFFFGLLVRIEWKEKKLCIMRILDWTTNVDVHVKSNKMTDTCQYTEWMVDGENFLPEMFCFTSVFFLSFILFFSCFFFFVHCAGYRMIKKPFLTPAEPFSTIIVNQRMPKTFRKSLILSSPWKNRHCYGQQGFPFIEIQLKLGGATIAQVTLQNHSNILCFSRCTFRKSYFVNKIQCLRSWYEPVNFRISMRKNSYVYVSRKKRSMTQGKRQMEVSWFLNSLCAISFEYMQILNKLWEPFLRLV